MSSLTRDEFKEIAREVLELKHYLSTNTTFLNVANKEGLVTMIINRCNDLIPFKEALFEEIVEENDVIELPDDNTVTSIIKYGHLECTLTAMTGSLTGNITRLFNDVDFHTGSDIQQLIVVNQQKELITVIIVQKN